MPFVNCSICRSPIYRNGTFNKKFGACHKECLESRLKWIKRAEELENAEKNEQV